jgi:ribonuclease P protein component
VLPQQSRMRRPEDFRRVLRTGRRAGGSVLAGHLLLAAGSTAPGGRPPGISPRTGGLPVPPYLPGPISSVGEVRSGDPAKVGFIVSRAVGSAVVRNRVKRRLRELMRRRVASLPGGSLLVLRAHPAAAGACQADLAADLDLVIGRLLRRQVGALRQE